MKVLVFAKQIPDVNEISFDPETNRIIRENVPLLINSFDKKAVEEAIRMGEKHGWETAVATMGPPQSKEILNDSLRMGIDNAYLITDRAFAGADTLITSRVLAKVVSEIKPDLVLMGKYSLDGETSQVPPEVAVLSGYNFKSSVSRIEIEENGKSCIVEHENEKGLTGYRVNFPAVLSVSEKINRARAIKDDAPDMHDSIVTLDAAGLGLDIQGSRDSPTVVTGTQKIESGRKVSFIPFDEDVFHSLIQVINRNEDGNSEDDSISLHGYSEGSRTIMGFVLDDVQVSLEIASKISEIANDHNLNVVMAGNIDPEELDGMSCHKYIFVEAEENDVLSRELTKVIRDVRPDHVVIPSTIGGREVSAMIAADMGLGLTADCIDVSMKDGKLVQYKPAFGGGIVASIVSKTSPDMTTVRPGMFRLRKNNSHFRIERVQTSSDSSNERLKFEPVSSDFKPLGASETVIGVGRGLKGKSNLAQVMELSGKLSSSVGGTRPVVDMRWMPRQQQIGLTGVSISPKTYISIGVSGQDNHVVGIRYAKKVIAVNTDREAPIFKYADIGIVADAIEFVTKFNEYLSGKN